MVHISDENLVTHISAVTNVGLQPSLIWYSDVVKYNSLSRWKRENEEIALDQESTRLCGAGMCTRLYFKLCVNS